MLTEEQVQQVIQILNSNPSIKLLVTGNSSLRVPADDVRAAQEISKLMPKQVKSVRLTELGIIRAWGNATEADAAMSKLEQASLQNSKLKRVLGWMKPGAPGIDFSDFQVRDDLKQLAASGVITNKELTKFLSFGEDFVYLDASDIPQFR